MKSFLRLCRERLFGTRLKTFLFFLFLLVFAAGVILFCALPLQGGGWVPLVLMLLPFIVHIIGSLSDIQ